MSQIRDEFFGSDPASIDQYYRGGGLVPNVPANSNVPTSGAITYEDFYSARYEEIVTVTSSSNNLDVQGLFSSADWSSAKFKRVIINSGVVIGSTSTGSAALTVPSNFGNTVILENNGSIRGAGGNGGVGGDAIRVPPGVPNAVEIENQGEVFGGGGAGGVGGTGGTSSCPPNPPTPTPCPCGSGNLRCEGGSCPCGGGSTQCCCQAVGGLPQCRVVCCRPSGCTNPGGGNPPVSGGIGGAGGRGRGYTQSNLDGVNGSLGPDCSGPSGRTGGRGGRGGFGGTWGVTGERGDTGLNGNLGGGSAGTPGGSAGNYIINDSNVTWIGGRGTVAGGVA